MSVAEAVVRDRPNRERSFENKSPCRKIKTKMRRKLPRMVLTRPDVIGDFSCIFSLGKMVLIVV